MAAWLPVLHPRLSSEDGRGEPSLMAAQKHHCKALSKGGGSPAAVSARNPPPHSQALGAESPCYTTAGEVPPGLCHY